MPTVLLRRPYIYVEFSAIGFPRTEFQDDVLRAAAAYASVWHQVKDSLTSNTSFWARASFFVMRYESPHDQVTRWERRHESTLTGKLSFASAGEGFGATIIETNDWTREVTTVYDQPVDVSAV
jgi:hypothetical protein